MQYIKCRIIDTIKVKVNNFWRIIDEKSNKEYLIRTDKTPSDIKVGRIYNFHLKLKGGKNYVEFVEKFESISWKSQHEYIFKIKEFNRFKDKNNIDRTAIIFSDAEGLEHSVLAFNWQLSNFWVKKNIKCRFEKYSDNRTPVFSNIDFEHPVYIVGETYDFKPLGFIKKYNKVKGENIDLLELSGEDGIKYDVPLIRGQEKFIEVDVIKCVVVKVDHVVRLKQAIVNDPYFNPIDQVITNSYYIKKYVKKILDGSKLNYHEQKFQIQYSEKHSFWVFTFCNQILPTLYNDACARLDYKCASDINEMLLEAENWILKKGIISSIPDRSLADRTTLKVHDQIRKCLVIQKILTALSKPDYYDLLENVDLVTDIKTIEEIFFLVNLVNFDLINEISYCKAILSTLMDIELTKSNIYYLRNLSEKIATNKTIFFNDKLENIFELIENGNLRFKSSEYQTKFFNWSYCEYKINLKLNNIQKANLILATIERQYFYIETNLQLKESYLYHSYYTLNNYDKGNQSNPFTFENGIELKGDITENPNLNTIKENPKVWEKLESIFSNNNTLTVKVEKRLLTGFEVQFENLKGFLPNNRITDDRLKNSVLDEVDYTINTTCVFLNREFSFFIVQQLDVDNDNYLSKNNIYFSNRDYLIDKGRIDQITEVGLFVETERGRLLIHKSNISDHIWDFDRLKKHFNLNQEIFFVWLSLNPERLSGSMKLLYDTDYRVKYNEFLNEVENDYLNPDEDFENLDIERQKITDRIQIEKGYCFEQLAVIQIDLSHKILNLKMAIELFDSAKSLRTQYATIYTSYFETLLSLEKAIKNYTAENLAEVNQQVNLTRERITETALISFPDFEKLMYFLNIILLFNEKSDESIDTLYNYVKSYSLDKKNNNLSIIAKITLSNNLMTSAGNDVVEYSKKNLALIFSYIRNGILSLKESVDDRLSREISEKIAYWKGRISYEESPTLEFKSTLRTPILDSRREKELKQLKSLNPQTSEIKKSIDKINGELATRSIIHSVMKSLCAFANTNGGTVLIGVTDSREICGIQIDYKHLKQKDRDGFGKKFDECIKSYFDESFSVLLNTETLPFPEGDVFVIEVSASNEEVFLLKDEEGKQNDELYIRNTTSSEQLKGKQLAKYIKFKALNSKNNESQGHPFTIEQNADIKVASLSLD